MSVLIPSPSAGMQKQVSYFFEKQMNDNHIATSTLKEIHVAVILIYMFLSE